MIAFNSVGHLRNNYFKISSNAPSNLIMKYLKIYFLFPSAVFRCLSNDIALKGLFLHHCVVFSLFCVAIVISEPFFARAYFRPDFAAIRWKKFNRPKAKHYLSRLFFHYKACSGLPYYSSMKLTRIVKIRVNLSRVNFFER